MHISNQKYTSNSNSITFDVCIIHVGVAVGATLGADKLENTAKKLVQAWPILGGNISKKAIPFSFTCGENLDFRTRSLDQELTSVIKLDRSGSHLGPMVLDGSTYDIDKAFIFETETLWHSNFTVRVTFLKDSTLLNFSMPHSIVDAASLFDVVSAFCSLLKNDPIHDIQLSPDVRGVQMSTLVKDSATREHSNPHASYEDHQRTWMPSLRNAFKQGVKSLKESLLFGLGYSKLQERLICIPRQWLDTTRNECMEELNKQGTSRTPKLQLSVNDIVVAWLLKVVYGHGLHSEESVDCVSPFNTRNLTGLDGSGAPYLHNSFCMMRCHFSVTDLRQKSVAWIAAKVRSALLFYRNPPSVRCHWRFLEDSVSRPTVFNTTGQLVGISSWSAFDFANLDFPGANPDDGNLCPPILFVCPKLMFRLPILPNGTFLNWKDGHGNIWIRGLIPTDVTREFDVLGDGA
ncbi:hypothetical protein BDV40DRAFT_297117 [Aspergillus tamarii]|uniref:Transferase family-domain-containing protein n=1 Tax=Aspergillus tamarii TaxID=41984 RepID=A0A5N6V4Y6_ASPTM|nr:hypothetical protein BDV40DRAFT_297117 [Aspergillus tamarii]